MRITWHTAVEHRAPKRMPSLMRL
jgi:putative transposase